MTYIVNENCIKCKYTDCVEVCPVDCFYEGENMLVIHPDECIDCGVCEPECPVDAIQADTDEGAESWLVFNRDMSEVWPNITEKKDAPEDADDFIVYCRDEAKLKITGLMCIPPVDEEVSMHFALLKTIAQRNSIFTLSMGMSNDFEEAIAFGANSVRIGSAIFGQREN